MNTSRYRDHSKSFLSAIFFSLIAAVPLTLVFTFYTLPIFEAKIRMGKQESTRIAVESIFHILETFQKAHLNGELTLEEAQKRAASLVKSMRYKEKEYFWINDMHPKMIMHPYKPELDGTDLTDTKDPQGVPIFVEMARVCKEAGEGFVHYQWPKQGESAPVPKVSFVKLFKPWNWMIGNGIYLDNIQSEVYEVKSKNLFGFALATLIAIGISVFSGLGQLRNVVFPIHGVITELSTEARKLFAVAERVSHASADLDSAGSTQASAIHQIAATLNQINEMVGKSSQNAEHSCKLAGEAESLSQQGELAVNAMIQAIQEISESNTRIMNLILDSNKDMSSLTAIMNTIASKTQIIHDIVFQTKLLSFNASVEAARAGEHGKGFSVVAEEVGNLARKSGESAEEIGAILQQSTDSVAKIAGDMQSRVSALLEDSKQKLAKGSQLSEKCKVLLEEIVVKSAEASKESESILVATQEQRKGTEEIVKAISSMDKTVQESNKTLSDTSKYSKQLLEQSQILGDLVSQLRKVIHSSNSMPDQRKDFSDTQKSDDLKMVS